MKRTTISLILILFSITMVVGQQDTLIYKYRRMSVDYQQQIKMAQSELAGAESMVDASKSDRLPKFDFYGNYTYMGVPLQLAPDADGNPGVQLSNIYSLDLGVYQPILTGGYLKNTRDAAMSQAEIMKGFVSLNEQEVMMNSDSYYWSSVTKKEISLLLIAYRDAIGEFLKVIQDRVDEEVVGMNELYQAKVRYDDAEYKVIRTEKEFVISIMELNRIIGLPVDTLTIVATSLTTIDWSTDKSNLSDLAIQQRPEVSMLKNKIAMNQYQEKITASSFNPQFGVGIGGNYGAPSPGLSTTPDFNYTIQANLAIPIFYWGKKKEEVFASRQQTEVSRLEMEKTKEMITLEVASSFFDLEETQDQLEYSVGSLDNATKNVDVMLDRYHEGLSSVLEVLDAQLYWQKTYLNYILAKYQLNTAFSSYQHAMGELSVEE